MIKTNYWISNKNPVVEWDATLPWPTDLAGAKKLLRLNQLILEAGEREAVYRVVGIKGRSSTYTFDSSSGCTYAQYIEKVFLETNKLLSFSLIDKHFQTLSKVCYYDLTGKIVEEEVDNLGEILKKTRPDLKYRPDRMALGWAPVNFAGGLGGGPEFWKDKPSISGSYFTVQIWTDIWFPQVIGFLEDKREEDGFDNRELALCHTPRLNRFLSAVRQLVLDYGGTWKIGEAGIGYGHVITESGIILEP